MAERRRPSSRYLSIDEVWMEFYAERASSGHYHLSREWLRSRNRLLLHYSPYVKAIVGRFLGQEPRNADLRLMARGMLALSRAIDVREAGNLEDFVPEVVSVVAAECRRAIREHEEAGEA